ncbi:MAG: hypothetical protein ACT4NY_10225 [Pseudonocardiales bacterium]
MEPQSTKPGVTADITQLILDDHETFRREFAALDDADKPEQLRAIWEPLAALLDVHAVAEEEDDALPDFRRNSPLRMREELPTRRARKRSAWPGRSARQDWHTTSGYSGEQCLPVTVATRLSTCTIGYPPCSPR